MAALVKSCTLEIQERRVRGIHALLSAGDFDPDRDRMSVQFRCTAVGVLVAQKVGGCSITLNQQSLVGEARRCLLIELRDRDVLHQLQRDTQ